MTQNLICGEELSPGQSLTSLSSSPELQDSWPECPAPQK